MTAALCQNQVVLRGIGFSTNGGANGMNIQWVNLITFHQEKLSKYSAELARKGKLDPVIGRESRTTLQVLSRRTKNNPVLMSPVWVKLQ